MRAADLIHVNEGRAKSLNVLACQTCGGTEGPIRAQRSRLFTIFMCDGCALAKPLGDEDGREYKLTAVAMEAM